MVSTSKTMSLVNIKIWIWMSKENITIYKYIQGVFAVTRKNGFKFLSPPPTY